MNRLYANICNELDKLWKKRRTKGFLLLTLLVPLLTASLLALLPKTAGVFAAFGSNVPMLMLDLFTIGLLPVCIFMTAVESFAGEIASRTLKLVVVRPITRTKVFASKVIAIAIWIALLLVVLLSASFIAGLFAPGGVAGGYLDSVVAYAAAFVPMLALSLIAALVALWIGNTTGAMAVLLLVYGAAKLVALVFPQVAAVSVFSYTNWHMLWIGSGVSLQKLLNSFVLLLAYCIMAYTAGWMLFDRKQL